MIELLNNCKYIHDVVYYPFWKMIYAIKIVLAEYFIKNGKISEKLNIGFFKNIDFYFQ